MTNSNEPAIALDYRDSKIPVKDSLLIPTIALGYVPFVIVLLIITSFSSNSFTGFYLYLVSGIILAVLLPMYTVYFASIIWLRLKEGKILSYNTAFHIISLIVPLVWLLAFASFIINFNGIV